MGIVYEGRDPNLDRRVAIKTVKVENLSEEAATEYEARFRTEARSAARLQHPNIVSVYDSDRDGDIAFLVMEYIQGDDLKHHLDKGLRYSLEQSLKMIRDLLSALDYAHKQGIVHRDIKPGNLLIEPDGRVKLTDFGVARIQDSGEATRTQGSMVGTLKYMSPEQVQGQKADSRADLFSVGVLLYQLLTDKRPFDGDNDFSIIHQIIGHTPPSPSSYNPRLPAAIDAVVARALAKDREQRFATARDFSSALQSAMRRAEDATIIPPANPARKTDGAVAGSGTGTGNPIPTSGSTVTQEIELVYWKDIKDSTDREELEGFLAKFPDGIYADLARRRLRKLASAGLPDQTVLSGATLPPADQDLEATRMDAGTTLSLATVPLGSAAFPPRAAEAAGAPTMPSAPSDEASQTTIPIGPAPSTSPVVQADAELPADFPRAFARPHTPEPQAASTSAAISPAPLPESALAPSPATWRRQPVYAVLAAIGALAAVGVAAIMLTASGGGEASAVPAAGGPYTAASDVMVEAAIVPTVDRHEAPAATAEANSASAASAKPVTPARRAASSVKTKAAPVAVLESRPAVPEPPPRREEPPPARAPVVAVRPSPVEACRDKVFLSREFCLAEQCDKAGSRNHPLCVKRREEARLREESRVRN